MEQRPETGLRAAPRKRARVDPLLMMTAALGAILATFTALMMT